MGTVLLLGGYGGIGESLTAKLTQAGRKVVIAGRHGEKAQACAERYGQVGVALDAASESSMQEAVPNLIESYGPFSGAVNLAGSILIKPLERTSLAEFHETLAANLDTSFLTLKYLAPHLAQNEAGGSIVLMSSVAARFGLMNHESVAAAKAGVIGLMLSAATSFAGKGVRINCVAPALTETPLSRRFVGSEDAKKASAAMHPLGRIGQPQDVASLLAWLLEPENSWVTGQVFGVDGGMSCLKSRK
jgi:3-oxoacyl-[acyl-carrier protein] reductase